MKLQRVDAAVELCERHLAATNSHGTEVEAILTAYVSSIAYAEFESSARRIITERAASADETDDHLAAFARTAAVRLVRSIKLSELSGAAAWFDPNCKAQFLTELGDEAKQAWNSIILNRHGVAHNGDSAPSDTLISSLTFNEFKGLYPKALTVLEALRKSIVRR
jgi:hypothetical protein